MSPAVVEKPTQPATRLPISVYLISIVVLMGVLAALVANESFATLQVRSNASTVAALFAAKPTPVFAAPPLDVSKRTARDPHIGYQLQTPIPRPPKPLQDAKGTLLVFVGECGGCINVDFEAYAIEAEKQQLELCLLSAASPQQTERYRNQLHWNASVIGDKSGVLRKPLNPAWIPRCYIVSPTGKLLWIQKRPAIKYNPFQDPECANYLAQLKKGN